MKIAVNYDNGNIFQHFGSTKQFKLYEVENQKVVSTRLLDANPQGHATLAVQLIDEKVNIVICGTLGMRMLNLLEEGGIEVCGNVEGSCDQAVEAYLQGNLQYSKEAHACSCSH